MNHRVNVEPNTDYTIPSDCNSESIGDWRDCRCGDRGVDLKLCEGKIVFPGDGPNPLCGPRENVSNAASRLIKLTRNIDKFSLQLGKLRCPDNACCSKYRFCGPYIQSDGFHWEEDERLTYEEAEPLCTTIPLRLYDDPHVF